MPDNLIKPVNTAIGQTGPGPKEQIDNFPPYKTSPPRLTWVRTCRKVKYAPQLIGGCSLINGVPN